MDSTPKTAKVLSACLASHQWQQTDLATAAKIAAPTVSAQLKGTRPIRDDHLAAYAAVLTVTEQRELLSAWLQDVMPQSVQEGVLNPSGQQLQEQVTTFTLGLPADLQDMLRFWAERLVQDRDLESIFRAITRKSGYTPPAQAEAEKEPDAASEIIKRETEIGGQKLTIFGAAKYTPRPDEQSRAAEEPDVHYTLTIDPP